MWTLPIRFLPSALVLFVGGRVHACEPDAREAHGYMYAEDHRAADDADPASAPARPSRA
jgi:hypothetical protein